MDIDVSIIIPMYNTGKFMTECIASITSRCLNMEIIIIDDGSEDDSYRIVSKLLLKDKRIILLQTENRGLGNARNLGMSIAKGKCIAFIDSDDWIARNALDVMHQEMTNYDLDMVMGNALFYYNAEDIRERYKVPSALFGKVMRGTECYINLSNSGSLIPMVYCYMYKREFLERYNISFQQEMYEDELWTIQAMCQAERIKIIDFPFYYYRQRQGSIMHNAENAHKQSHCLITLSKNILLFSKHNSFANNYALKDWLHVRAIQMYYYALTKLGDKADIASFHNNNGTHLSELVKNRNETSSDATDYFFKYYLYRIIQVIRKCGLDIFPLTKDDFNRNMNH